MLPKILPQSNEQRYATLERKLLRKEAEIGGRLFGKLPKGRKRQFFCLDEHTWVWYEEWLDKEGKRHVVNTRYIVRPSGVLKQQNGQGYQLASDEEIRNLYRTAKLYKRRVGAFYQQLLRVA
jgi:hypothetical protein